MWSWSVSECWNENKWNHLAKIILPTSRWRSASFMMPLYCYTSHFRREGSHSSLAQLARTARSLARLKWTKIKTDASVTATRHHRLNLFHPFLSLSTWEASKAVRCSAVSAGKALLPTTMPLFHHDQWWKINTMIGNNNSPVGRINFATIAAIRIHGGFEITIGSKSGVCWLGCHRTIKVNCSYSNEKKVESVGMFDHNGGLCSMQYVWKLWEE